MLRFTEDEFASLQSRIKSGLDRREKRSVEQRVRKVKSARTNKYGAEKTSVGGIEFDSKAEARRYIQLKAMEQAGEISDLQIQVRVPLLPAQNVKGRKEKPVDYICDFVFVRDGETIYEDTKSSATKTPAFVIKRKLALYFHGIAIREVLMD